MTEALSGAQKYSEALRGTQRSSEVIRGHQKPSEALRGPQKPSEALRGPQRPSEALRGTQRHSEALICKQHSRPRGGPRCNGRALEVRGRVLIPQLSLPKAVSLVLGAADPIVLHDYGGRALTLARSLDEVLGERHGGGARDTVRSVGWGRGEGSQRACRREWQRQTPPVPHLKAVWEEARVHHRHIQVDDEQLGEDLVERLLIVLLRVARLDGLGGGSWLGRGSC